VSIVRRVAELHGLSVSITNRPAEKGGGLRVELRRT
jgi:signal transduction histidine kinase